LSTSGASECSVESPCLRYRNLLASSLETNHHHRMKDELLGIFEKIPPSVKVVIGAMLSLQLLGFGAWILMMMREGRIKKEKQS